MSQLNTPVFPGMPTVQVPRNYSKQLRPSSSLGNTGQVERNKLACALARFMDELGKNPLPVPFSPVIRTLASDLAAALLPQRSAASCSIQKPATTLLPYDHLPSVTISLLKG